MIKNAPPWILFGALMLTVTPAPGGVAVYGEGTPVTTLINGIISDDSDPVSNPWHPNGPITPGTLLGSGGPPHVAFRKNTAWPVVVWAAEGAINNDIVYSEWDGSGWTPIEQITTSPAEETAPRVFIEDDGTIHVVWWTVVAPGQIYLATRPAGSTSWNTPVRVSAPSESARRPSVAVFNGKLCVAYERDSTVPGMTQDVVLAKAHPTSGFTYTVLASTIRFEELDVMLHVRGDKFWADWKHGDLDFAESQFTGGSWSPIDLVPWVDPTWVGVEAVRKEIMQEVAQ